MSFFIPIWLRSGRHEQKSLIWLHKFKKHSSHWEGPQRFSWLLRYYQDNRSCFMSKSLTVFKGFWWNWFPFENDKFPCEEVWWSEICPQWWMSAGDHLYWKPYYKWIVRIATRILTIFRVCRISETFPDTPSALQCQQKYFQHKIKNYKIFSMFLMWFRDRFSSKNQWFLLPKPCICHNTGKKG